MGVSEEKGDCRTALRTKSSTAPRPIRSRAILMWRNCRRVSLLPARRFTKQSFLAVKEIHAMAVWQTHIASC
eukprot:1811237-Rhodomonas_salina.1